MRKRLIVLLLILPILFGESCSSEAPKKETEPEEELLLDDEELSNSYAEELLEWSVGDPTNVEPNLPSFDKYVLLDNSTKGQIYATSNTLTVVEEKEGFFEIHWEDENGIRVETVKQISSFEWGLGVAYEFKTFELFGSYEDHTYELTWDVNNEYFEWNNIYSDEPNLLLSDETQKKFMHKTEEYINIREKWVELTDDEEIFANINSGWTPLTKIDGEWVIFSECRYGAGGLYFDFEGKWLEFSGGGDAYSQNIVKLLLHDDYIEMHYKNLLDVDYEPTVVQLYFTEDNILIFKRGEAEERYVAEDESNRVKLIEEECDEEDY